jgi:hypothetical protein
MVLAPPIKRLLRSANLAHCIGDRRPLSMQNFNLPKLRHNIFGLLSFSSHRWSSNLRDNLSQLVDHFQRAIPASGNP